MVYLKGMTGRIKWPDRDTQIMSIFGAGD